MNDRQMIECGTCGYPLLPEERTGLVEVNGKMEKPQPEKDVPETNFGNMEPVAWRNKETGEFCTGGFLRNQIDRWQPLYTAPPQREWQGLTDDEIEEAGNLNVEGERMLPYSFARAIEAKLRQRNV